MASVQLQCPFCGATLNFGQAIPDGTPVSCLVCSRAFPVATSKGAAAPRPRAAARARIAAPGAAERVAGSGTPRTWGMATGVALAGVLLLFLLGFAYLFWANVLARRGTALPTDLPDAPLAYHSDKTVGTPGTSPAVVAVTADKEKPKPPPATGPTKKGDAVPVKDGEVDVADVPKKDRPTPPPVGPAIKSGPPAETEPRPGPPPVTVTIPAAEPAATPGYEAARVNAAINKGVAYLKRLPQGDGSWSYSFPIGMTGLAGLTLLECQEPPNSPVVQQAAQFVRNSAAELTKTYELACAILFLDRLNDPRDRVLIQGLAMRLLAGQHASGGWGYGCPPLGAADLRLLQFFLQSHRPVSATPRKAGKGVAELTDTPMPAQAALLQPRFGSGGGLTPLVPLGDLMDRPLDALRFDVPNPITQPFRPNGAKAPLPEPLDAHGKKRQPIPPGQLPPHLQQLSIVKTTMTKGWFTTRKAGGDNSNTQFALLALWAARRYDVPSEYALLLGYQRFKLLQASDGGWGYHALDPSTRTMLCVGLLGLATGHGALPHDGSKGKLDDAAIHNALAALTAHVGTPAKEAPAKGTLPNLYFLWSVERVAMLYDLKTFEGKDWYAWGAQLLLANQAADGSWSCGPQYTGSAELPDTCFALLFLKRSNLVADLTEHLRLQMVIRDPGAKGP